MQITVKSYVAVAKRWRQKISASFRQPATAALASIAVWLFFMIFWSIVASMVAQARRPVQYGFTQELIARAELEQSLTHLSPNTLYVERQLRAALFALGSTIQPYEGQ